MRPNSSKTRKQRRYEKNISKHEAHKLMSAPLSKELQERKGFSSLPVREGDEVVITRGEFAGEKGKVQETDPQNQRIYVDGVHKQKTDNTEIPFPIHPSNVVILDYYEKDGERLAIINRRTKDEDEKIDIDSVLASIEEEEAEDDVIEFDESEFEDEALLDEDELDLDEDEFDLIESDDEELDLIETEDDELDHLIEDEEENKEDEQ